MRRMLLIMAVVLFGALRIANAQEPAATSPSEQTAVKTTPVTEAPRAKAEPRDEPVAEWWQRSDWWLVISVWAFALIALALVMYTSRLWKATSGLLKMTADAGKKELRA